MYKFAPALLLCLLTAQSEASVVVPSEGLVCNTDSNDWGQPSHCDCPKASRYDERIGACLQQEPVPIMTWGKLAKHYPDPTSSSFDLSLKEYIGPKSYKLVLNRANKERFASNPLLLRYQFEVEGELLVIDGDDKPTIIVDHLRILE